MIKITKYEAAWCQPCRNMDKVVEAVFKQLVVVPEYEKINIDEVSEEDLKADKIMSIPTFIIHNKDNKEIDRKTGPITQAEFKDWVIKYM